jgi:hypothetical protein
MGAVAAYDGTIFVTTRGLRMQLATDTVAGVTRIISEKAKRGNGLTVEVRFPKPMFEKGDYTAAQRAIDIAHIGKSYTGPSLPAWYTAGDLHKIFFAAPIETTVEEVFRDLFGFAVEDDRPARSLSEQEIARSRKPSKARPLILVTSATAPRPSVAVIAGRQAWS